MAELNTISDVTPFAAIVLASCVPGIDGDALLGAFAGAALVAATSRNLGIAKCVAYMLISLVMGYLAAPEIVDALPIRSTGIAAFFAAALVITVAVTLIDRVQGMDLLALVRRRG
ncbi:putative holin [Burkholderia ubonensis]|uniref:Phage holin n=1 Tax=Burkholderia ubonensis TaxID=101571 RepID=A0AAW3NA95_9BURK|nr:putative holin [Burkholderia ubonensis]KVT47057.1 hypothetical protein WK53_13715 [Burkholderia ubonensis]